MDSPETVSCYQGRYHRTCGKHINSAGKVAPKKFLLGTDPARARRIAERLTRLWAEVDAMYRRDAEAEMALRKLHSEGYAGTFNRITGELTLGDHHPEQPLWNGESLLVAEAVRQEAASIKVACLSNESAESYLQRLDDLRSDYALIAFMPDPAVYRKAVALATSRVERLGEEAAELERLTGAPVDWAPGGMLYEALDVYVAWARNKYTRAGALTDNGRKVVEAALRLKDSHVDVPLSLVNHDVVEAMADYWYKRPEARKANGEPAGRPISVETVKNMIKHLRRFLRWLHRSDRYAWRDLNDIIGGATAGHRLADIRTEAEKKASARGPESWTLGELTTLYRYATDRERLYILLGLNAGFAQSELGHLERSEVLLGATPPALDFVRHKTGRRGGVKLWPETVQALTWAWRHQGKAGAGVTERAILTDRGSSLSGGRLANAWNALLDRVQKTGAGFRRLPFKYLRKTSAQLIQDVGGGDSEVIALMHARARWTAHDEQADRYYRRSLDRVYAANDRVHAYLQPMFQAAPDAFTKPPKRGGGNVPPDLRERIQQRYAACGNTSKVARELNVSRQTVYRHLGR